MSKRAEQFLKSKYPNGGCHEHSQFGYDELVDNMNEFAKVKCKEQRELCSHALTADIPLSPTHNLVLYAPEPTF